MKEIKLPSGEYLLVEVPEDANHFRCDYTLLQYFAKEDGVEQPQMLTTAPGQWSIVGKASELTRKQWEGIIEGNYFDGIGFQYANYSYKNKWEFGKRFNDGQVSGWTFVLSNGFEWETTLILKAV